MVKSRGKVYTPDFIVNHILDLSNYKGETILKKHVIDNSCGDGAFLVKIVERYIKEALNSSLTNEEIINDLETYIHGIEIEQNEQIKCIKNVSQTAKKYNLKNVSWDIICANSLEVDKYNGKMNYVLGNPPYIRVHNLGDSFNDVKKFQFSQKGMTDLFIVFYEIGLKMLGKNGILGYITPSSLYNSLAGKNLRKHFVENNCISKVVDLKHNQVFNATTYTTIMVLANKMNKQTEYYEYESENNKLKFIDNLSAKEFYINSNFYFGKKEELLKLKEILNTKRKNNSILVKNGFATLKDNFFIGEFDFNEHTIPIIKASTGERKTCFFPYKNNNLISYQELTKNINIKKYLEKHKSELSNRSLGKKSFWYGFGRSQGIKDVYSNKFSINTVVKDINSIKLIHCHSGMGVYSGVYILTKLSEEELRKQILTQDFINYIKLLAKYKNGGYYTYSSNDLKKYLDYKTGSELTS